MAAKVRHLVTLELAIDPDEPVDPVGQWDWAALLDMPPDDVRVVGEAATAYVRAGPVMLEALRATRLMIDEGVAKLNWGASALDAKAIRLLNDTPIAVSRAIRLAEETA